MLSGTAIGFICVLALLLAALLIAMLDRKEKGRGNLEKSQSLSRLALVLFLTAFVGGVVVTLVAGVRPRAGDSPVTGRPMGGEGGAIGLIDEEEFERLKKKVEKDPKDVSSRERLGHLYLQRQDFENVFRLAHEVLQLNPDSAESRVHMGMVLFAMQDLDAAIAQFDKALSSNPKNTEALLFKGIVQFQGKDDLQGARETWERFLEAARPDDPGRVRVEMFLENIRSLSKPPGS